MGVVQRQPHSKCSPWGILNMAFQTHALGPSEKNQFDKSYATYGLDANFFFFTLYNRLGVGIDVYFYPALFSHPVLFVFFPLLPNSIDV